MKMTSIPPSNYNLNYYGTPIKKLIFWTIFFPFLSQYTLFFLFSPSFLLFFFFLSIFYFYHDFFRLFYTYILDDVPKRRTLHGSRIPNIINSNDI